MSSRAPGIPVSAPVRFPPNDSETTSFTTACNYCVVGCGYRAYVWDAARGSQVPSERVPHMSSSWTGNVSLHGTEQVAAVVPDLACPVNRGNYSVRGGTLGRTLTSPISEDHSAAALAPAATRERLTTPMIRLSAGGWAAMDWDETLELMSRLIQNATDGFTEPRRVGAKRFGYHSLENTYAAATLFSRVIGTPNVADHDRPSTADSSPGLTDAGLHHHAFSYDDLLDCDVVVLLGSNAYECQSVMFQQAIAGRRIVVLDPRRTITADYAVRTGGIHLQPRVLGADCTIINAIARLILEEHYGAPELDALRRLVPEPRVREATERYTAAGRLRAARRIRSFDAWQATLRASDAFDPAVVAADTGIPIESLHEAATLLATPSLRAAILYEKGLIWGYNYQNTAAVANLAILTFNFNAPNRPGDPPSDVTAALAGLPHARGFCGRLGGHQKGEARPQKDNRDVMHSAAVPTDRLQSLDEGLDTAISHYQDYHLAGTVAYEPPADGPRIVFTHPEAVSAPDHPEDISLLWVIGCNPAGDTPDAQRKWRRVGERLAIGREADLRAKEQAKANLLARVTAVVSRAPESPGGRGLVIVQQDVFPNFTSEYADVLLPATGFGEDPYTRYNGERCLRLYDKFQDAPLFRDNAGVHESRCRPDWWIFTRVAQKLAESVVEGFDDTRRAAVPSWQSAEAIFVELAAENTSNRSDWLRGLRETREQREQREQRGEEIPGYYDLLRARGTRGYQLPVWTDASGGLVETSLLPPRMPFFVDCRWQDVQAHQASLRPRPSDGEVWLTNGRVNEAWNSMYSNIRNDYINERYPDDLPGTLLEVNPGWARSAGFGDGDVVEVEAEHGSFVGVIACQDSVPSGGAFALFSYPCNTLRPTPRDSATEGEPTRQFFGHGYANNATNGYVDPTGPISANKYGKARIVATSRSPGALPTRAQRSRAFTTDVHRGDRERWMAREILVSRGLPRVSILARDTAGAVVLPGTTHGVFWRTTHASRRDFVETPLLGQFSLVHKNRDGSFDPERSIVLQMLEGRGPLPAMPLRAAALPDRLIRRVRHWIETGCAAASFSEMQRILDHAVRIHARWFGPTSLPAEMLVLDPDDGIDRLSDRAELFLELIRPGVDGAPSRMCWRSDSGTVLSDWTARECDILRRFLQPAGSPVSPPPRTTYADVCQILDTAVAGEPVMALHGAFWRRLDRDAFLGHTVIFAGGEIPLVRRGDGANSALVQSLRGTGPFVGFRMPVMRGQVSPSDIQRIEEWIDHGCP